MPLTDTAIRAVKPLDKPQKLFDGNGLFLFVAPSGTKSWRVKNPFRAVKNSSPSAHTPSFP